MYFIPVHCYNEADSSKLLWLPLEIKICNVNGGKVKVKQQISLWEYFITKQRQTFPGLPRSNYVILQGIVSMF